MKNTVLSDDFLTEIQVANLLNLQPTTLRKWRWQGRGPVFSKLGGSIRYRGIDVEAFVNAGRSQNG
jgi:hypothetical protein